MTDQVTAPAIEMMDMTVKVPKETMELAQGLAKLIQASRQALADGFQPTLDVPVILVAAVKELPAAVGGLDKLGPEFQADKGKLLLALSIALDEVI